MDWKRLLKARVEKTSQGQVARELGYSASMVSQLLKGTYKAGTERVERRVTAIYGHGGLVPCPSKGPVEPLACAEAFRRARRTGLNLGNAASFRAARNCLICPVRAE